nr:transmembrane protein 53 [Ipomoea batatas]
MEATLRLAGSSHRHIPVALLLRTPSHSFSPKHISTIPHRHRPASESRLSLSMYNGPHIGKSSNALPSIPSSPLLSHSQFLSSVFSSDRFARISSNPKGAPFDWHFASDGEKGRGIRGVGNEGPVVTVVLLGWLGSKPKHLRRYVELYNSKGFHAVTFVTSVRDVLSFDLARKLEERVASMARELASWVSQSEEDGRERALIFHTFSNTGWLTYGAILDNWRGRKDLLDKIKGCVVDSGADPHIDPKVWAAGFTVALLKKRSSLVDPGEGNELDSHSSKIQEKKSSFVETLLLDGFEKLFSILLNLPNENRRLVKIISTLMNDQPPCPQLYLYSTSDMVIPYQSIELFIKEQSVRGRKVSSFNFGTSPHVDHYRTFPSTYASLLQNFLEESLVMVKKA